LQTNRGQAERFYNAGRRRLGCAVTKDPGSAGGRPVLAALAVLAWVWAFHGVHRQDKVIASVIAAAVTALLLLLWFLLFSRARPVPRLAVVGLLALLAVLAWTRVEFRGFTGDIVPVFGWKGSVPSAAPAVETRPSPPVPVAGAADWPQFLGPSRSGVVRDAALARDWSARPPRLLWRRPVGLGWSGFAVVADFAVTHEQHGPVERVSCYDTSTGRLRWHHDEPARFEETVSSDGPRATPTIRDGRVFALGATGILTALDLADGRPVWRVDILADSRSVVPPYGVSHSPLVLDVVVVVAPGGSGTALAAHDLDTGRRVWAGGAGAAAYSSPLLVELAGRPQILLFNEGGLAGHDPSSGQVLWSHAWPGGTECVSQPVRLPDDRVYLSSGYGVGGRLFRVAATASGALDAEVMWESRSLKAKFTNVVYREGFLYGLDDGILACVDAADGERRWKGGRYGHGQLILADDLLIVQAERGDVFLVEATPERHRELGRLDALDGKTWNHAALAGRRLLVRNDREAAAFELPVRR
jgi:outer membrane protein assembly factor BamB